MGEKILFYLRKINFIWLFLRIYFYVSGFILSLYPFWFGLDFLKNSNHPVLKWITGILKEYAFLIITISIIGIVLKFIVDEFIFNKLKKFEGENEKLKIDLVNYSETLKSLSQDILKDFSINKLDSEKDPQMRVSLYVKNKDNELYCLGRYSRNQKFSEISADTIYKDKGIISKVWINGNDNNHGLFDNTFPEYEGQKNKKKYWKKQLEKYGLDKEYVEQMKMKSRLYYAYRIEEEPGQNPLGVILIESLSNTKYNKEYLDNIIEELSRRVSIVLSSTIKYLDSPNLQNKI